MQSTLEVLFAPAEFAALKDRDLANTVCVVFDVLRATTSMLTALRHGAAKILLVKEIPEALAAQRRFPGVSKARRFRLAAAISRRLDGNRRRLQAQRRPWRRHIPPPPAKAWWPHP